MSLYSARKRWNSWAALATLALLSSTLWISGSNAAAINPRDALAAGVSLRVLPIGEYASPSTVQVGNMCSITYGAPVEPYNGYRKPLYEQLKRDFTNNLDFVGHQKAGDFADPDNEGWRGEIISEIKEHAVEGIYSAPNVVLLHIGTNNMKNDADADGAPSDLESLIDLIYLINDKACIFLCKIIPANPTYPGKIASRIPAYNDKVEIVANKYKGKGKAMVLVDMNSKLELTDLHDGLHPTTNGYAKMAAEWYKVITDNQDLISKPGVAQDPPTTTNPDNCRSTPAWYHVLEPIAEGAKVAYTDGDYKQAWGTKTVIHEGNCKRAQLRFMDLNGDGLKDYACVNPDTGETKVAIRGGVRGKPTNDWGDMKVIATGAEGRKGSGVMFADLNNDGRDDYIYVDPRNGAVSVWINEGEGGPDGWMWKGLGVVASQVGATSKNLQMVDLNGDGRADFCIVSPITGKMTAWINNGADDVPDWYKIGDIATGASKSEDDIVLLGDFTGNGRADYMLVGKDAKVTGFLNRLQIDTIVPRWSVSNVVAEGPDGVDQDSVRLVDMTGNGQVDYMAVGEKGKLTFWENKGTGGKYQEGEGVVLCDLDGDGVQDYFWLDHEGKGWGYLNQGKGKDSWYGLGEIAKGVGHAREDIRMGVLTKSGRADYLVVTDEDSGEVQWWQNLGPDYDYNWASRGVAATGPGHTIRNEYGWKFNKKNVRFADLDGDGLDDYLYIHEGGAVIYWKNNGDGSADSTPTWGGPQKIADGPGVVAGDVQFADTNGDGHNDYVVVSAVTGNVRTWHWLGWNGDAIRWNTPLPFAERASAGHNIRIAEVTADGRADYVTIHPDSGELNLWRNDCWGTSPGDPLDDPPYSNHDIDAWCGNNGEDGKDRTLSYDNDLSAEEQSHVWGSSSGQLGVGQWLDEWLSKHGERGWVEGIRNNYSTKFNDDVNGPKFTNWRCQDILGFAECDYTELPSCSAFYHAGVAPLYWVFRAVSGLNRVIVETSAALTKTAIGEVLGLNDMTEKFGVQEDDTLPFDIFITAMSGGAAIGAASAPTTGAFGGIGAFATLMGLLTAEDGVDYDLLASDYLSQLYETNQRGLTALLWVTTDGYYPDDDTPEVGGVKKPHPLYPSDLPDMGESTYQTSIAQYFQDGRFLIQTDSLASDIQDWQNHFKNVARQGIATALLNTQQWFVFIDEDRNTESECTSDGTNHASRRLINNWCYDLDIFLRNIEAQNPGVYQSAQGKDKGRLSALQDAGYGGLDLVDLYKNTLDCAMKYPDGDAKLSAANLDIEEEYPTCFFPIPVVRGVRYESATDDPSVKTGKTEPYINTSGRDLGVIN